VPGKNKLIGKNRDRVVPGNTLGLTPGNTLKHCKYRTQQIYKLLIILINQWVSSTWDTSRDNTPRKTWEIGRGTRGA
jgi:hypothetical protein